MAVFWTEVADRHSSVFSTSPPDATADTPANDDEAME